MVLILATMALAQETQKERIALLEEDMVDTNRAWRTAVLLREEKVRSAGKSLMWTGLLLGTASTIGYVVASEDLKNGNPDAAPTVTLCYLGMGIGFSWSGAGIALTSAVALPKREE